MTNGNMTFRPAARCGLDAGGNLRHLVGSAWSGGIYESIAGRFGRSFKDWVAGLIPGGRREGEMLRGFVSPTARCRAATTCSAWSGCVTHRAIGERCHRHVIVITPSRPGPSALSSSSGAWLEGGAVFSFLNSALLLPVQAGCRAGSVLYSYDGRFSEEVFLVPQLWIAAQNPRRGPGRPTERCGQGVMRGTCISLRQVVSFDL